MTECEFCDAGAVGEVHAQWTVVDFDHIVVCRRTGATLAASLATASWMASRHWICGWSGTARRTNREPVSAADVSPVR